MVAKKAQGAIISVCGMIKSITIQNIATIKKAEIHFAEGFNIITGETGSGKSLIFDAISLSLGFETDRRAFRPEKSLSEIKTVMTDHSGNQRIYDIKIPKKGRAALFLNGEKADRQQIRQLSSKSVLLFGQNKMSELLKSEYYYEYLDCFSGNDSIADIYRASYEHYKNAAKELSRLEREKILGDEKKRLAQYEKKEMEELGLKPNEWEETSSAIKKIENFEKIKTHLMNSEEIVCSSEKGIFALLKELRSEVNQLEQIDSSFGDISNLTDQLCVVRDELERVLSKMSDFEFDSEKLNSLRQRREKISSAMRKFNCSFDELIKKNEEIENILSEFSITEETIKNAREKLSALEKEALEKSLILSEKRKKHSQELTEKISRMLESLGFKGAEFKVIVSDKKSAENRIGGYYLDTTGKDDVDFSFSANPDIRAEALSKVVSGGELSRIALAIQATTMQSRLLPVVVFDEIDIGISGKTAQAVGKYLHDLSSSRQIIAITHLPQIASFADHYIEVRKNITEKRAETSVAYANDREARIKAVAALASGKTMTKETLDYAESLINSKKI